LSTYPQTSPFPLSPSQLYQSFSVQWREMASQIMQNIRVALPAFLVQDMDVATQTVMVQIALQEIVKTTNGAESWDYPPISYVPVVLPRGGGFSLTLPLKKGDKGLLVFCDHCFDLWWQNGTTNAPKADNAQQPSGSQKQLEVRHHHFWDCGFFPGMMTKQDLLPSYSTNSMQIRSDDGNTVIDVAESGITITASQVTVHSTGNVQVTGANTVSVTGSQSVTISGNGNTTIEGRNFLNHTHSGVSAGSSTSGPVV
jgi:hypothetical protein